MPVQRKQMDRRVNAFLLILAVLLFMIKYYLATSLPVEARHYNTDDLLMVRMAESLLEGNWLGNYDAVILMKGAFFPLFLAATNKLGLSYLSALTICHFLATTFFISQMRFLIRDRQLLFVLLAVLLFDPCSYSSLTFQRVYRSSLTEIQVLFLFGSYFGVYLHVRDRRKTGNWSGLWREVLLSLIGGCALWSIWNTREESVWVIPFITVAAILIAIELIAYRREQNASRIRIGLLLACCLLPLAILMSGNTWICRENKKHYGVSIRLEEVDGEFAGALKTIYSVKNEIEFPYVTVSSEKLERLYTSSDSLRLIRPELDEYIKRYDQADRNRNDGQVEDGWFFWALKYAAFENGVAGTLPDSQIYWDQVRLELEAAINKPDSILKRQTIMPSALMSPWRREYLVELPKAICSAISYTVSYEGTEPLTAASGKASAADSHRFELITNNQVVYPDRENEIQRKLIEASAVKLKAVINIFRKLNPVSAIVGVITYLSVLIRASAKKEQEQIPFLLVVAGMMLSAAVILIGTAYTHITGFFAIKYDYLAGIYPLMLASEWIPILYLGEQLMSYYRKKMA